MPTYKLQKKHRSSRRVEVRTEHIDIHVPALLICAVLAFFIWLYIVGLSHLGEGNDQPAPTPENTVTEAEGAASATVSPDTLLCQTSPAIWFEVEGGCGT